MHNVTKHKTHRCTNCASNTVEIGHDMTAEGKARHLGLEQKRIVIVGREPLNESLRICPGPVDGLLERCVLAIGIREMLPPLRSLGLDGLSLDGEAAASLGGNHLFADTVTR